MENKIPIKYVIELGLIRKRDKCAKCGQDMDVPDYHIQLCMNCRKLELDKYVLQNIGKGKLK